MEVRTFEESDWSQVWPIVEDIVRRGDTFCYDPDLTELQARETWISGHVVVAAHEGRVLGTSNMYANRPGPGAHVASGNVMVAAEARGQGIGRALIAYLLEWARQSGFVGVQFNAVAASNEPAVGLYESLGFRILATVPGAFRHPALGDVGLHLMYADLGAAV